MSGSDFTPLKKLVNKGFLPFRCPLWQQNDNIIWIILRISKELSDLESQIALFVYITCPI